VIKMQLKLTNKRYVDMRKKLLLEKRALLIERMRINSELRRVREDMANWDKALLNGEGE